MVRQNWRLKEVWGNMESRLFSLEKDLLALNELLVKRDMSPFTAQEVPILGVVVEKDSSVIAMGFIRQCEGFIGIFDSIITNPNLTSKERDSALNVLYGEIISLAKSVNILKLIGFSLHNSIVERSKAFGFIETNHKLLSLKIRGS